MRPNSKTWRDLNHSRASSDFILVNPDQPTALYRILGHDGPILGSSAGPVHIEWGRLRKGWQYRSVRLAGSYRCWFVKKYCWLVCVREKYCSDWKFMIVYDKPQPNEQAAYLGCRLLALRHPREQDGDQTKSRRSEVQNTFCAPISAP